MKTNITKVAEGKEGVALPEDYLMKLELVPGAEVEITLDEKKKWIIIRPMHGEDFLDHFKESMENMA